MPADRLYRGSLPIGRRAFLLAVAASSLAGLPDTIRTLPLANAKTAAAATQLAPPSPVPLDPAPAPGPPPAPAPVPPPVPPGKDSIVASFADKLPTSWGLQTAGTAVRLPAGSQAVALTFDCCGGPGGNGVDQALIEVLRRTQTPATFFLNFRWLQANPATAQSLAEDPLFEIGNHGTRHVPLSVSGRSAYGIRGTSSAAEVYDEIMINQEALHGLTGAMPLYFRPGTAYFDEIAVAIVRELGLVPLSFSINGDGGATYPPPVVLREVAAAKAGDIVIAHANHPGSGTAAGITSALGALQAAGIQPRALTAT